MAEQESTKFGPEDPRWACVDRYLRLLEGTLTRTVAMETTQPLTPMAKSPVHVAARIVQRSLRRLDLELHQLKPDLSGHRADGTDFPANAETMIGTLRMDNVRQCAESVLRDGVSGDFIETGVWRGGTTIFMAGILEAWGAHDRTVWVADSFKGLPRPNSTSYPKDKGLRFDKVQGLAISREQVEANFRRYGLLSSRVKFLEGWFKDTLPNAPIERLALLRLDGDLYESTIQALEALYPKLQSGGYCIVDDYSIEACASAVNDYRTKYAVSEPIVEVDWTGVYWRKA